MIFSSLELALCSRFLFSWCFARLDSDRPSEKGYGKVQLTEINRLINAEKSDLYVVDIRTVFTEFQQNLYSQLVAA